MSVNAYPELEITLHQPAAGDFRVELRFDDPDDQAERAPCRGRAALDLAILQSLELEPARYGQTLGEQLFGGSDQEPLRALYREARALVDRRSAKLRLRLQIADDAAVLHGLRWELLRDPQLGENLATSERVLFSRFLFSADWRPAAETRRREVRALVAIAAPTDIERFKLAPIDRAAELERARTALAGLQAATLGDVAPCTLNRLVEQLRGGVEVLYLVCHGALRAGEPWLFLQDDAGMAALVPGADLADRLRELATPPRLVVLASCESGGKADGASLGALAPRLGAAGVPAVLAMQGQITMETVARAMPVFFRELLADGQLDRALAVARGSVLDRDDAWMPALYLRLKGGRLWYVPGLAGEQATQRWQAITTSVRDGTCVPILGPDFGAHLFGDSHTRAAELARSAGQLADEDRDPARVHQEALVAQSRDWLRESSRRLLRSALIARRPELAAAGNLYEAAAAAALADPDEPYRQIADLGLPVYLQAGNDPLLLHVLAAAGRKVKPLFCHWRRSATGHPREVPYEGSPTAEAPVLCFPFGVYGRDLDDTLVLTEDDFLDYLIAAADYKLLPTVVRGTLVRSSLVFLGFRLDTLAFRVLFRLILALEGSARLFDAAHIGVQVDPHTANRHEAQRARRFLEDYFAQRTAPRIDLYWGTVSDFCAELRQRLAELPAPAPAAPAAEDDDDYLPGT